MNRWHYAFLLALVIFLAGLYFLRRRGPSESLAGIDANHDGVRDDVEKIIEEKYRDGKVKIVARELYRGMQEAMLNPASDAKRQLFALDCLYYVAPEIAGRVSDEIEAITLNTRARIEASWRGDAAHSGTILPKARSKKEACGFDHRLLESK